jgi:hypothetical protein
VASAHTSLGFFLHAPNLQGDFFDWSPQNFLSTKSLYNFWHLEKFRASLHGIWNSAKFRGDQSKKSPCTCLVFGSPITNYVFTPNLIFHTGWAAMPEWRKKNRVLNWPPPQETESRTFHPKKWQSPELATPKFTKVLDSVNFWGWQGLDSCHFRGGPVQDSVVFIHSGT